MILSTDLAIAIRCPVCGREMLYRFFSIFQLKAAHGYHVVCPCGAECCHVSLDRYHKLYIGVEGVCCEETHEFFFDLEELREGCVFALSCDVDDVHLAYFGMKDAVLRALAEEGTAFIEGEEELKLYFEAPRYIGYCLKLLNDMMKRGDMRCNCCGSLDVNMDIQRDGIAIHCGKCGEGGFLPVAGKEDLFVVTNAKALLFDQEGLILIPEKEGGAAEFWPPDFDDN